jgi:serine protease Do
MFIRGSNLRENRRVDGFPGTDHGVLTTEMAAIPPHHRVPRGRAARLAGVTLLALAVVTAGSAWLGLWGRGADRTRPGRGLAGDPGRISPIGSGSAGVPPGDAEPGDGRPAGPRSAANAPGLARDRDGGDAGGAAHRRAAGVDQMLAFFDEFERQLDAAMARARESVVALEYTAGKAAARRRRHAAGVVINLRGEILSVRIDPPPSEPADGSPAAGKKGEEVAPIVARDFLGNRHVARWVAADPHTGLTLLRVSPRAVRPIRAAVDGPKLGSQVGVLGNPYGMGHSVNRGHIAGLDWVLELGERQLGGLIQVQALLHPGDSGAAVVDVRGDWLGLIRAVGAVDGVPGTDFGFAIPTRDALWIAEQLRAHGRVDRAYLGVGFEPMPVSQGPAAAPEPTAAAAGTGSSPTPDGAWQAGLADASPAPSTPSMSDPDPAPAPAPGYGARIREVIPGTPAAEAGLRPGDRIVALDGQPIRSRNDLIDRLDRILARKSVVLAFVREGEPGSPRREVTVRMASRSAQPDPGPDARPGALAGPRSTGAGVSVTPTASQADPPSPSPSQPSSESNPAPPPTPAPAEARPGPAPALREEPPATPGREPKPAMSATASNRPDPAPPATGLPAAPDEPKVTVPRAVFERIEYLERRLHELEHVRSAPGTGPANGAGDARDRERAAGRAPGSPNP